MIRIPLITSLRFVWCLSTPVLLFAQSSNTSELLGETVNSEYNEIGPVISPDGKTLFFSRISHPQNAHGDKGSQDIWHSELRNNRWSKAVRLPNIVNKDVYNAIYSITPDGNTILLKGSYLKGVYQTRGFSISKKVRRSWSVPETLEIPDYEKMSKGEFDCGFLANDGQTIIMSFSEKKKGRNDDLYVSFKGKDGKWSKPQSLGSDINTPSHMETTPFLAADGLTLYFSSDRPGGKGGNDIYSSRRLDGSWKKWTRPVNLGAQVNTPGFEGYYTVAAAGDYAYWSSNNEGVTRKGDVYRLSLKTEADSAKPKQVPDIVASKEFVTAPDPVAMITGKVLDNKTGKPLEASIIFSSFPDGKDIGTASTDPETGEYKFTLPYGGVYTMRPVVPGFVAETESIDLTDASMSKSKRKDFLAVNRVSDQLPVDSLAKQQAGTATAVTDVGAVRDADVPRPEMADGGNPPADTSKSKTGTSGMLANIAGKDTSKTHVRTYQEMDKTLKVVPIEVGEVVKLNNIFFETASSTLRSESKMELDQMLKVMKDNTTMRVQIGGHTDSEGGSATNLALSQERANAVKSYLLQNGIAADRVESVGFGEDKPVAENTSEEGRSANRRVEFTILRK